MAAVQRHFRKYWKRYVFGNLAVVLGVSYLTRKHRDKNITREYCRQAKAYGDGLSTALETPKKVVVFLNPKCNNLEAKTQFTKFSAPLLHLSGMDVTIVESEYEGQIRTLMGYIDPTTDAIVVAGGDGTLMEVVNGLLRRQDAHKTMSIPIGVIPLGKENQFFKCSGLAAHYSSSPARRVGEATMNIINGTVRSVHLMEIEPEKGKKLYSLSSIQWGAYKDAMENKDSFRLFGKFRLVMSHISTALKRWPVDHNLDVWMPAKDLSADSASGAHPPHDLDRQSHDVTDSVNRSVPSVKNVFVPHHLAKCANQQISEPSHLVSRVEGQSTVWGKRTFPLVGFKVTLEQSQSMEDPLTLRIWPASITKGNFIQQGWSSTFKKQKSLSMFSQTFKTSEMILQPQFHRASWLSVDGEMYETMPLSVKALPHSLRMFTTNPANNTSHS